MTRVFPLLAAVNGLALLAAFTLGWVSKWQDGVHHPEIPIYWLHFLLGLTAALVTLFVHCIIFTYFLGTGRWVKEVALAYGIPDQPYPRQTRELKRRVFPPALFAMLSAIATAAAGAAAHVGAWPWPIHATLGSLALAVNGWAYWVEYHCLRENVVVLEAVTNAAEQMRAERGLPTSAAELEREEV